MVSRWSSPKGASQIAFGKGAVPLFLSQSTKKGYGPFSGEPRTLTNKALPSGVYRHT
jgi:hypothetical protein